MKQHRYIHSIFFLFGYLCLQAQISESFTDTLWPANYSWIGQIHDFKVNNDHQLQSIGNDQGHSVIFRSYHPAWEDIQWDLWIKMAFAPSDANKMRIYLYTSDTSLSNAYYLEIGTNGSNDAIQFYKLIKGKPTFLCSGVAGAMANDPSTARLQVTRHANGRWRFKADYLNTGIFGDQWEVQDTTFSMHTSIGYAGIECIYSGTRKDKFYIDDVQIDHGLPFVELPAIHTIFSEGKTVYISMNVPVEKASATDLENYVVIPYGQPTRVEMKDSTHITLTFNKLFTPGDYEILCKQFIDLKGNISTNVKAKWKVNKIIQTIRANELLITEAMIDPSPSKGLPEYEYVEIFNNSNREVDLTDLTLRFDKSNYSLDTNIALAQGEYLILCASDAVTELSKLGRVCRLIKFPSLRNTNGTISIVDGKENIIHRINYTDDWYADDKKKNGGWSLEMINPANVCDAKLNWIASNNSSGGTPGKINSVWNTSYLIPLLLNDVKINNRTIELTANKSLSRPFPDQFSFSPNLSIHTIEFDSLNYKVTIQLADTLPSGILYDLKASLYDCTSFPLSPNITQIAKVEKATRNDLVINEILFNPVPNGSDFIELYNRSNKILSLDQMVLSNEMNDRRQEIHGKSLVLPETYWVITPHAEDVLGRYQKVNNDYLLENTLPTLPDDLGNISLWTSEGVLIDSFNYSETYHSKFLNSVEGVALERIDANKSTDRSNWHSASGAEGFGTPTRKNSVGGFFSNSDSYFSVAPKVFSPDGDGMDDVMILHYSLPGNDFLARITIFDDRGREIKRLANNLSISNQGILEWNGRNEHGSDVTAGIYIIAINALDPSGVSVNQRLTIVLAR